LFNTKRTTMKSIIFISALLFGENERTAPSAAEIIGAWQSQTGEVTSSWIASEKYFAIAIYNEKEKQFIETYGGSWRLEGNKLTFRYEFHTTDPAQIGKEHSIPIELKKDRLVFEPKKKEMTWKKLDSGAPGKLAGAWLITGRYTNNEMQKITPGARRTMKILSGTRFQWIAYNEETREFFGTGGGSYTTENGVYTETIDFFSRDASRVGMALQFNFALENGNWRHTGKSSKGDPIDEIWTRREKIGI